MPGGEGVCHPPIGRAGSFARAPNWTKRIMVSLHLAFRRSWSFEDETRASVWGESRESVRLAHVMRREAARAAGVVGAPLREPSRAAGCCDACLVARVRMVLCRRRWMCPVSLGPRRATDRPRRRPTRRAIACSGCSRIRPLRRWGSCRSSTSSSPSTGWSCESWTRRSSTRSKRCVSFGGVERVRRSFRRVASRFGGLDPKAFALRSPRISRSRAWCTTSSRGRRGAW